MFHEIGIDEVGRGPLAGPIVVAAALVPKGIHFSSKLGKLKDSKKLTKKQRAEWFSYLREHPQINFVVARVYTRMIEKVNISRAANLAALRAVKRLIKHCRARGACNVFLDGGLYLGKKKGNDALWKFGEVRIASKTIVKGDETIKSIKVASILAKETRDAFMIKLAKKYPGYGLEIHKGYATKMHREALRRLGPTEVHRKTFLS